MHRQPGCWLRSSHSFKECVIAHWSSGHAPKMYRGSNVTPKRRIHRCEHSSQLRTNASICARICPSRLAKATLLRPGGRVGKPCYARLPKPGRGRGIAPTSHRVLRSKTNGVATTRQRRGVAEDRCRWFRSEFEGQALRASQKTL